MTDEVSSGGPIAQAQDGAWVELEGVVRTGSEELVVAPLSRRRCIAYRVHDVAEEADGARLVVEERACDFYLEDDSGRALVRVEGAQIELEAAGRAAVVTALDMHVRDVEQHLSDIRAKVHDAEPHQRRALSDRIAATKALATLLYAARAQLKGNVHVGGDLTEQARFIREQSARLEQQVSEIPTQRLDRYDVALEEGHHARVSGRASWEHDPDPSARSGGYRERPRRLVLRGTAEAPLRLSAEGKAAIGLTSAALSAYVPKPRQRGSSVALTWLFVGLVLAVAIYLLVVD